MKIKTQFSHSLPFSGLAISFLIILFSCSDNPPVTEKLQVKAVMEEDTLDLGMCPVGVDTAIQYLDSANILLKIAQNYTINPLIEEISKTALDNFRIAAADIHKNNPDHDSHTHFVTGLMIWFGITNNAINCLYQPISLCSSDGGVNKDYTVFGNGETYVYSNGEFTPADSSAYQSLNNYSLKILLKKSTGSTQYRRFVSDTTARGDTKAIIYTFQEMDSTMLSNGRSKIKLWNYAYRKNIKDTVRTRQSIMLSPDTFIYSKKIMITSVRLPFKGRLANHANPCPPSCNSVRYTILEH